MKCICAFTLVLLAQATYAADSAPVPDPYGGPDKRPTGSENVTGYVNEDGTSTTTAVVVYGDGHKEFCITQTAVPEAPHRLPKVTSQKCTRILSYLK
jgi:hypothetical protein